MKYYWLRVDFIILNSSGGVYKMNGPLETLHQYELFPTVQGLALFIIVPLFCSILPGMFIFTL